MLFRGKRLDNGEWVEGDYFRKYIYDRYDNGSLHHLIGWQVTDNDGEKFNDYEDVDPDTVGQYTGMKDKNGNDIWEGDIVTEIDLVIFQNRRRYLVVFENGATRIGDIILARYYDKDDRFFKRYKIEVISNIHDHPDLLK